MVSVAAISLETNVIALLVAAIFGAIGGFVYELLQVRRENAGKVELPWKEKGRNYYDLGWIASIVVGAVAAMAVLYVLPPVAAGDKNGLFGYDLIKLVGLSLISGSAGTSVLGALHSRALDAIREQDLQKQIVVAEKRMERIAEFTKKDFERAVQVALADVLPKLENTIREARAETPRPLKMKMQESGTLSAGLMEYLEAHPPTAEPEIKSREKIKTALDEVTKQVMSSVRENMDEELHAAQVKLSIMDEATTRKKRTFEESSRTTERSVAE
jgi:hypothetical protein